MSVHHLKIATTNQMGVASVEMDGEDITTALCGLELRLRVQELNSATLDLVAPMADVEGEFEIGLREETQTLLKRLGWTPPA